MAAISCDICGGSLSMDASGEFAVCDACGMKHTKDRVKAKAQEITGTVTVSNIANIESLMKRGYMALEDMKSDEFNPIYTPWKRTAEYFDKVLDIDPEYSPAYVGKLCLELGVQKEEMLGDINKPISENSNFQKALRFADTDYRAKLEGYNKSIQENIEEEKRQEQKRIADLADIRKKNARFQNCISVGSLNIFGLRADGTVVAIGDNKNGQCNTRSWRDIVAISTCGGHIVGLKADGTVVTVGNNKEGQCNTGSWRDIVAIAAGGDHTIGLKVDGTVVVVGKSQRHRGLAFEYFEFDVSRWRDIVGVSSSSSNIVGLKKDGTVVYDGVYCGYTEDWRDIVTIATSSDRNNCGHIVGLKADGTVVAVEYNEELLGNTGSWRDIVAISTSSYHIVGLKTDGTVVAVGHNANGQFNTENWRDIGPVSEEKRIEWKRRAEQERIEKQRREKQEWEEQVQRANQSKSWQEQGLCRYCGGQIGGLFTKKCKSCGKEN